MTKTVEFLFDLGSPYSYLAWHQLPKVAAAQGARTVYTPVLLGGIFQATGNASPAEVPAKARYLDIDLARWAQAWGLQIASNPAFPIHTLALMRGAVAMQMQGDEPFQRYMQAMYHAMFGEPRNMGDPAEVAAVLTAAGFDAAEAMAQIGQQAVKDRLKDNTSHAIARGVFGVPSFFVGDELFWGQDRLDQVAQALARA
ncbi:2-hydroxychromene-2-carboxylate isomerase [Simplicispira hankyongi]|uniref:2-hydroxychromene-2-carboxylate isomerase n=1 Tax=Simplicispira hankyongi TaxID=2315688 RepID=A0A398CAH7_9BURK|nr:2-hydroxychromene-2-carboxylate isomerase [Simplicispira hankyongi]RID99749.1 2-hydroxychromene-2-carboxylate isomerase [Simplicispira hankyongi]